MTELRTHKLETFLQSGYNKCHESCLCRLCQRQSKLDKRNKIPLLRIIRKSLAGFLKIQIESSNQANYSSWYETSL